MTQERLTVRFSAVEMATIERLSAALNVSKASVVKLAISKLSEGKSGNEYSGKIDQLGRAIFRSVRMLWATRSITDKAMLEKVETQLSEIWKHVE